MITGDDVETISPDAQKRVLVVDDSFIMRRLVTEIVESDPDFQVVDTAENGKVALHKVRVVKPDLVILDIEMPEMSGIETLRRLGLRSRSKVVILSFRATEGSAEAIEARRLGAVDVLEKPSGSVSLDLNARMGSELVTRLRRAVGLPPRASGAPAQMADGAQPALEDGAELSIRKLIRSKETILANLAEGVLEFDDNLRVTAVNASAQRILRRPELSLGDELVNLFADYNLDIGDKIRGALASNQDLREVELEFSDDDGDWVNLRLSITVVPSDIGAGPGALVVFEDIGRERSMMQMLQQTSSRSIATKFLQSGKGDLGGGIAHSTVMFCDIRGFTNISEKLGAPNVVSLLNEYFSFMEDVIASEGGAVDKYIGDAIMAIFGVPESTGDDARRACRAAQRMLAALDIFNAGRAEQERLAIGIGLATGEVIAGNIGSPSRLNYTVIGDTVNMASRLEALTKVYGTDILICEKTRAGLGDDFPLREIDRVKVRGQKMPITLFEVVTRDPATMPAEWLSAYQAGRTAYEAGKFTEALDQFTIARRSRIDDRASALLVERCRLLATALPPKWDGVWQME